MTDPLYYQMLIPLGLAIIIALVVFAHGIGTDVKRTVRRVLIILGIGILIPIILFLGFTVLYFAGGGH